MIHWKSGLLPFIQLQTSALRTSSMNTVRVNRWATFRTGSAYKLTYRGKKTGNRSDSMPAVILFDRF